MNPFGFDGSPGISGRIMETVLFYRQSFSSRARSGMDPHPFYADVFVDDGMFVEESVGRRQEKSAQVWGRGADLFFGTGARSARKLELEGQWLRDLVLMGYYDDLQNDLISFPCPEILGAAHLINTPEFDSRCQAIILRSIRELRGRINRWGNACYIWRRLTEPVNQMMNQVDASGIWIRCADWGKWSDFWSVVQFIRDLTSGYAFFAKLFTGCFSELSGIRRESTETSPTRTCTRSSGDSTPDRIGWRIGQRANSLTTAPLSL